MISQARTYKLLELFILFILFPVAIALDFPIWIKFLMGIVGFVYIIYILIKIEKVSFKPSNNIKWKSFWRSTLLKFIFIALVSCFYVWITDKNQFFVVIRTKPILWLAALLIYILFSVFPQEILYRAFFFQRYKMLVRNGKLFIFLNAVIFSLGHLFFKNELVIILTFIGGLLFAITYSKTNSTVLVSIEHAIYGSWLFTVGMGTMLGFPS